MTKKKKNPQPAARLQEASPVPAFTTKPPPFFLNSISQIRGIYLLLFCVGLIQLIVFNDYIFLKKLYLFLDIGSDSYNLFYPAYVDAARHFRAAGIATWSFSEGMGESVFPGGLSNPFGWIFCALGPDRLAYGIIYVELLKMMLTGVFFYLYLSVADFSKYTSILGGVLASSIGYLVLGSSGWYAHSSNVLYFVLLLYAFELFYRKNNPVLFPIAVFFVAVDAFRLYIFTIFLFTYALLKLISDKKFDVKGSVVFLLKLAGLGAIGVGMSAMFSMGSLLERINSPRVTGDVKASGKLLSLPMFGFPDRLEGVTILLRFFSNDLLGAGSEFKGFRNYLEAPIFYAGLLPLLLAPQVLLFKDKQKKIAYGLFFLAWMMPLAFPFFRYALYAFMGNYYKHGLSVFIPAITLIYGLNGMELIRQKNRFNYIALAATLAVLLTVLYLPYFKGTSYAGENMIDPELRFAVACFLVVYAGVLCFLKVDHTGIYVKSALMLVVCVELAWFSSITVNHRIALTRDQFESRTGYNDYTVDAVDYLKSADASFYRINKDYSSSLAEVNSINDAKAQGYFGTPSYSSFNRMEYIEFLKATEIVPKGKEAKSRWSIGLLKRPFLQAVASVKYNLLKNEDFEARDGYFRIIYEYVARFGDVTALKNKFFLPLGFTYDTCILAKDYESLSTTHKDMAMFCAAVTDTPLPGLTCAGQEEMIQTVKKYTLSDFDRMVKQKREQALKITSWRENHIIGDITLDAPKLLFFSIPIDSGWKFSDNGKPVPAVKVNIGFMGIILDKGTHHIELKYHVRYLGATLSVTLASLLIYLVMVALRKKV